jgi:hypothetical protein
MTPEMFQAFAKEAALNPKPVLQWAARGLGRIGDKMIGAGKETATIMRDSMSPMHLREGLSKGFKAMSNTSARKVKIRADKVMDKNKALRASGRGGQYVDDFSEGTGLGQRLRRWGVTSNTPKYVGDDKVLKARNMVQRALPGEAGLNVPMMGLGAAGAATQKTDAQGRPIGVGERAGRTALGLTTGIVGMRGGMVSGMASGMLGDFIGARAGRLADKTVLRKRMPQRMPMTTGAAPTAKGV